MALGDELRRRREEMGLSLREIERRSGLNSGYLSQLERNEIANPKPAILQRLAPAYEAPFTVIMQWAGYVESDSAGISPNAQRALSVIGDDFTDKELEAIKAVLDAIRGGGVATFAVHRTNRPLTVEELVDIRRHAMAVLREIDCVGSKPIDLDDALAVASLVRGGELVLSLGDKARLRERFGSLVDRVIERVLGAVHFDSREVFVQPDMIEVRRRFVTSHEIGHAVLPDHRLVYAHLDDQLRLSQDFSDQLERQANQFAIELLSKGDRLRAEFDDSARRIDSLQDLADRFELSREAAARRIAEESRHPIAVSISHRTTRGLSRPRVYCSRTFDQLFGWRATAPVETLREAIRNTATLRGTTILSATDRQGNERELLADGVDTGHAIIELYVPPRRRPLSRAS